MTDLDLLWTLIDKGKKGDNVGISSGLSKLDKLIGGIQPHRYYLCGAASSVGKTAFILFIMYNILKNEDKKRPVYFQYYSLEIGADVLLAKLMSLYCAEEFGIYLTINDILSFEHPISDEYYEYIKQPRQWRSTVTEYIDIVDTNVSADVLYARTCKFAETIGHFEVIDGKKVFIADNPNAIIIGVIDHFALMNVQAGRTLKQEIDLASSYMVTLKRKLPLSWFALMQQNRASSDIERRKLDLSEPGLNDLKDSGSPSQDSDVVMQLFYPFREKLATYRGYRILGENGIGQNHRSLILSKNRYGIANQVINLGFYGSVGWWIQLPPPEKITDYTQFHSENGNIPLKNKKETLIEDDSTPQRVDEKKPIKFNFNGYRIT